MSDGEVVQIVGDFEVFYDFVVDVVVRLPSVMIGAETFPSDTIGPVCVRALTVNDVVKEVFADPLALSHVDLQTAFVLEFKVTVKTSILFIIRVACST